MRPATGRLRRKRADTYALVLDAAGVPYVLERIPGGWLILVEEEDFEKAASEIAAYRSENPPLARFPAPDAPSGYSGALAALLLFCFYLRLGPFDQNPAILAAYGSDAERILDGQIFRAVTSLFLHGDFLHLLGNMAGCLVFGSAVARTAGYGAGWLLILATGFLGNLLTALAYGGGHLSGGASTAVFGAIGLLGGFRLGPPGSPLAPRNPAAWMVLGSGVLFLALLGNSPEADFSAHFFGYASGVLVGLAYVRIFSYPLPRRWQAACLYTAAVAVFASFVPKG